MRSERFNELVLTRLEKCQGVLVVKEGEYSVARDRLHNFKRAAALLYVQPETALLGMWAKHLVSILDIVDDVVSSGRVPTQEVISEKFGDAINYLLLLEGLLEDRRAGEFPQPSGNTPG